MPKGGSMDPEAYDEMVCFVRLVSRLTRDRECSTCYGDGISSNPNCTDHQPWVMPDDDARNTVNRLIMEARLLVKQFQLDQHT
jgi:hypothetical protein